MKYRIFFVLIVLLALAVLGVFAFAEFKNDNDLGLVELRVQNMTCGSCVKNIQKALVDVGGVEEVAVSVTVGRAKVQYDPGRTDASSIAEHIEKAGYPAAVAYILSPDEFRAMKEDESRLAADFVARIGDRLLSREDFEKEVKRRQGSSGKPSDEPRKAELYRMVWQEVMEKELLLAAAELNGVVVQDGEVDLEYQKMQSGNEGFEAFVAAHYGSREVFMHLLKEKMIINRNIEENVVKGEDDSTLRQRKLNRWYRDLVATTPVTIFDPALKAAVERGGAGCGGSCCG